MKTPRNWIAAAAAIAAIALANAASAQSVTYGRITAVNLVSQEDARAQTGGAILGGALGAAVGSGRSGSNRVLGGIGGAFAGQQLARLATQRQAFEYTVLIGGTSTIRMITDEAGLRVGDCVAVERGHFNNLRLVDDSRCRPSPRGATAPAPRPTSAAVREATACDRAKEQLLAAETEEAFDIAERRMRLLCSD